MHNAGGRDIAQLLLDYEAHGTVRDWNEQTAQNVGSENERPAVARRLIDHGSEPKMKDRVAEIPFELQLTLADQRQEMDGWCVFIVG